MKEFPDVEAKIQKVAKYRKEKMDNKFEQLNADDPAAAAEQNANGKGTKKPLLRSADYFFNVLIKNGKRVKKEPSPKGARNNNPLSLKTKGPSDKSLQQDHLESFKKLQDFTGAIGQVLPI